MGFQSLVKVVAQELVGSILLADVSTQHAIKVSASVHWAEGE